MSYKKQILIYVIIGGKYASIEVPWSGVELYDNKEDVYQHILTDKITIEEASKIFEDYFKYAEDNLLKIYFDVEVVETKSFGAKKISPEHMEFYLGGSIL